MNKKFKKVTLISLSIILTLGLVYGVAFYFSFFQGFIEIKDNKISSNLLPDKKFKNNYKPKLDFSEMPITNEPGITFNIFDETNIKDVSVILKSQRYYIPVEFISSKLGYSYDSKAKTISNNITLTETTVTSNNTSKKLRGNIITQNNIDYISIADIESIFNIIALFKFEDKSITFVRPDNNLKTNSYNKSSDGRIALIRLEDFSAGQSMDSDTNQPKLKAMANFLSSQNINYHIAWIPRFKCPDDNIDNNLLENKTFENVAFINTLDYLINKGGLVGLHGYTHQHGAETSGIGTDLGRKVNNSEYETRKVIESAINTATALNIPYSFFESSHYKATTKQKKIIEEYVQYIYEPMNYAIYTKLQKTKNNNLYIPTPLSYVSDLDTSYIERGLTKPRTGELASLFYHPSKEFDFIEVSINNDTFRVKYSQNSPLQKIAKLINDNKYVAIHIDELINSN